MDGQSPKSSAAKERLGQFMTYVRGDTSNGEDNENFMATFQRIRQRSNCNIPFNTETEADSSTAGASGRGAAVLSVLTTIFGVCTGASPEKSSEDETMKQMKKRGDEKYRKSPRPKAKQALKISTSRDECDYAQHYNDDHGRAARATLVMKQNEDQKLVARRKKSQQIYQDAVEQAGQYKPSTPQACRKVNKERSERPTPKPSQFGYANTNITPGQQVAVPNITYHHRSPNQPTMIHHILTPDKDGKFDDDISAISAHTLEEMINLEALNQLAKKAAADKAELPPSPVKTESSDSADDHDDVVTKDDIRDEASDSNIQSSQHKLKSLNTDSMEALPQNPQNSCENDTQDKKTISLTVDTDLKKVEAKEYPSPPSKPTAANSSGKSFNFERHPHDEYPIHQGKKKGLRLLRLMQKDRQYYEEV